MERNIFRIVLGETQNYGEITLFYTVVLMYFD